MMTYKRLFRIQLGLVLGLFCTLSTRDSVAAPTEADRATAQSIPIMSLENLSKTLGGPTLVSLHLKNATLREAIAELARQSKFPIEASDYPSDDEFWKAQKALVTVDVDNVPFWQAVAALTPADCTLVWSAHRERKVFQVVPEPVSRDVKTPKSRPTQELGLFTVIANSYQSHIKRDLYWQFEGKPDVIGEFREEIKFSLQVDPKLWDASGRFWLYPGTYLFPEITDDTGEILHANDLNPELFRDNSFSSFWMTAITKPPADKARFLKAVRGRCRFSIASKITQWEIPIENGIALGERDFEITDYSVDKGAAKNIKVNIKVAPYGNDNSDFHVQLQVANGRLMFLTQLPISMIQMQDATGKIIPGDFSGGDITQWQANYHIPPRSAGVPTRLVISLPTQVQQLEVPFEFHDLPLPARN